MRLLKLLSRLATCLALCSTVAGVGPVWGQNVASSASADSVGEAQLEEITVTAQKFAENLEKTPLAITAITGDSMRALGIFNVTDLAQVVPNLSVGADGLGAQVGIRGIVSNNRFESGDPAVSFNVDGVYLARQRSAIIGMYDIDHIEVLRGPQGTLYGRNAVAGAINVITKKPDLGKESAEGSIQYGNYNEFETFGVLNFPVSETFGLRAAFESDRHDGYSNNAPSKNYNDLDAMAGRVEALWRPTDKFSALLSLDFFHNGAVSGGYTGGASIGIYSASTGATPYNYPVPVLYGQPYGDERAKDATLSIDWELPLFTVSYVGNYRKDDWEAGATLPLQGPIVTTFGGVCATLTDPSCNYVNTNSHEYQTSHEFRLSDQTDRYRWVLGLYYFKEHNTLFTGIHPCPCGPDLVFLTPDAAEQSRAAFGQATWDLTQALRLTGGVRYTSDFKGRNGILWGVPGGSIVGYSCTACTDSSAFFSSPNISSLRWTKTTWKAGIDYDVTPDSMLFASVATGYKAGGYNDGSPPNLVPFEPENVTNYELGLKNDLLNRRLQVNVDVFHSLYKDYQASGGALVHGVVTGLLINAGKATIDGVELETAALLTPLDRLGFNATYLNGRFTSFVLPHGDGYNNFQPEDLTGNRLPSAPRTTFRLDYQHTFLLASGASIVPRIDTSYVGAQELEYHNFPVAHQGSYTRTGLSLSYNAPKTWSATAWVRNLENKAVLSTLEADNSVPPQYIGLAGKSAFYMAPRTYGLRLAATF